jgi:hypothetical protein
MATPSEKLAESLAELKKLQNSRGIAIIKSDDLSRTHKERLAKNGFIREVIKGWYIASRPEEKKGDSTSWYASFWNFTSAYIDSRFGKNWCLSPEQSLSLHSGNFTVPTQLLVRSLMASNNKISLFSGISFFDSKVDIPAQNDRTEIEGVQVYTMVSGLIACGADFFSRYPVDARTCLTMVKDSSEVLAGLLDGGKTTIAGRLAGAFRNIGKEKIADEIVKTMKSAGYDVREEDPFKEKIHMLLGSKEVSPYANRIKIMWQQMRQTVINNFPQSTGLPKNIEDYLKQVEDNYSDDAYNSLSIEGYFVTPELIEKVRSGNWNPNENKEDKDQKNAMAARGYYQAFQAVKKSIGSILKGKNAGEVANNDHSHWYQELFAPSVAVGILKATDLVGYRNGPVYIKGSMHTPPNYAAIRDVMPVFFDLLKEETEAGVRVILGHFIFVYIHPYFDGNGRIARFLMNAMMASGGYPWTVVPHEKREEYMSALEKASVGNNIEDFTQFISNLLQKA